MKLRAIGAAAICFCMAGCTVNAPFDPSDVFGDLGGLIEGLQSGFENAIEDPLRNKPFPIVFGGDNERVFYATNLTDIRIKFPGPTNDVIIPGLLGPSNVYKFQNKERELIRPLVPAQVFAGMVTDGAFLAYLSITSLEQEPHTTVVVSDLIGARPDRIIFQPDDQANVAVLALAIDSGRLAFEIVDFDSGLSRLRVESLRSDEPAREFDGNPSSVRLHAGRLAYVRESGAETSEIILHDLATDETTVIAGNLDDGFVQLFLTDNRVVWGERGSGGLLRIWAHDLPSGTTFLWADAVEGDLVGASDEFLLTEEYIDRSPDKPDRIAVVRYDAEGKRKKLAEFNADGFAGQSQILGDRAVWVNPDRRIVIQPLAGGDRKIFKPF